MKKEAEIPEIGFECRKIVRACRSGALGTLDRETGAPYVSLCAYGCDELGHPIFLLSDLADHTQNIAANNQVSFLCEQASHLSNPQAGARVSLMGRVEKLDKGDNVQCTKFLQIHPSAKNYADFTDFNFYRLNVEKAHFVGGFGRAKWADRASYLGDSAASLWFFENQEELISQLHRDYPEFASLCAVQKLKKRGKNWKVLRLDTDGVDLKLASKFLRYPFEKEVKNRNDLFQMVEEICK